VVIGDLLKARQRLVEEAGKRERIFGHRDLAGGVNTARATYRDAGPRGGSEADRACHSPSFTLRVAIR
jgi:hypothetical protein